MHTKCTLLNMYIVWSWNGSEEGRKLKGFSLRLVASLLFVKSRKFISSHSGKRQAEQGGCWQRWAHTGMPPYWKQSHFKESWFSGGLRHAVSVKDKTIDHIDWLMFIWWLTAVAGPSLRIIFLLLPLTPGYMKSISHLFILNGHLNLDSTSFFLFFVIHIFLVS